MDLVLEWPIRGVFCAREVAGQAQAARNELALAVDAIQMRGGGAGTTEPGARVRIALAPPVVEPVDRFGDAVHEDDAAELAVGEDGEIVGLLLGEHLADGNILRLAQLVVARQSLEVALHSSSQGRRPEQAADLVHAQGSEVGG